MLDTFLSEKLRWTLGSSELKLGVHWH
jgi:hypothetical protein